jgi:Putative zinc-finger
MLTCKQASQFISQSLDRPLTLRERLALKLHLFICKYCKRFSQQLVSMRVALETMTKLAENDNSIEMPEESKKRIAENVKKHLA